MLSERKGDDGVAGFRRSDLEHLAGHSLREPVYACDAVLDLEDGPHLLDVQALKVCCFDFAKQDVLDFARAQGGFGCHGIRVLRAVYGRER
jgi:hypothetical protein